MPEEPLVAVAKYGLLHISKRTYSIIKIVAVTQCDEGTWEMIQYDTVPGYEWVSYTVACQYLKELTLGGI